MHVKTSTAAGICVAGLLLYQKLNIDLNALGDVLSQSQSVLDQKWQWNRKRTVVPSDPVGFLFLLGNERNSKREVVRCRLLIYCLYPHGKFAHIIKTQELAFLLFFGGFVCLVGFCLFVFNDKN